jgi:hypothetical protein
MAEGGPRARRWKQGKGRLAAAWKAVRHPKRLWREHRRLCVALAAVVVLAIAGAAIAYESLKRPADVHNENAVFKPEKPKKQIKKKTVPWPLYGYDRARTRYLPAKGVRPPFRDLWRYTGHPLLEFPPVVAAGRLFFVNNSGYAIS